MFVCAQDEKLWLVICGIARQEEVSRSSAEEKRASKQEGGESKNLRHAIPVPGATLFRCRTCNCNTHQGVISQAGIKKATTSDILWPLIFAAWDDGPCETLMNLYSLVDFLYTSCTACLVKPHFTQLTVLLNRHKEKSDEIMTTWFIRISNNWNTHYLLSVNEFGYWIGDLCGQS